MFSKNKMNCFLILAETLSFTETAKRLYMTQQGVSKYIAQIEEEFGFALFIRTNRSVVLTKEGARCYALFSTFMKDYTDLLNDARGGYAQQEKILRVGYQNWLDFGTAPGQARAALLEAMPELQLVGARYSPGALIHKLLDGSLDLIVIHKRFSHQLNGFKSLVLNETPMVLMAAKSNPLNKEDATYKTFAKEPAMMDTFEGESPSDTLLRAQQELSSYGLSPSRIILVHNRDSVYTAAELGQGIMVCSSMAQIMGKGTMVAYPTRAKESLMCYWRDGSKNSTAEKYSKLLQQEYRNQYQKPKEV